MTQEERYLAILHHLEEHGRMMVEEICDRFGVSRDTARRDLVKLEEDHLIIRIRGGAMRKAQHQETLPYADRLVHSDAKRAIAIAAATLIEDGQQVLFDTSTTIQHLARRFTARQVTVITNSIDTADELSRKPEVTVYLLGGRLNIWHRNLLGPQTVETLRNYRVHTLFLGACGMTPEGLSSPSEEEAFVKREMIRRAGRVVVLADGSKYGRHFFQHVCPLSDVDVLVSDREPAGELKQALELHGVQTIIIQEESFHEEN